MVLKKLLGGERDPKFYFFSGKGGVGKTSMAASTAIWFASKGKRTLVVSTDPAHSLADSFKQKIGSDVVKLKKNLYGLEIDPEKAMQEYKEKFAPQMEKLGALEGLGLEDTFDVVGMTPGIDEIASFDRFLRFMGSKEYDIIIFDTAPTGHALRFLSLPDVLDSWVGKMIKIRMRFSGLAALAKKILPFGDKNDDDDSSMGDYNIPVKNLIVNQIIPNNDHCEFCNDKRKLQLERLDFIKEKFSGYDVKEIELLKEELRGDNLLEKTAKNLYG
ncbi:MAG: ArsA family ATPase [Deltaproteobacteria bacterium]|nr:ArsA family ATPase [Deltaproteobacteria bacterium]